VVKKDPLVALMAKKMESKFKAAQKNAKVIEINTRAKQFHKMFRLMSIDGYIDPIKVKEAIKSHFLEFGEILFTILKRKFFGNF